MEIILFVGLGILAGIVTGLIPGLHINTIAAFVIAMPSLGVSGLSLASFLIAMTVVYAFISFIPSILIGAPDSENVLSVLPAHRMLLDGEGIEAIKITAIGGGIALLIVIGIAQLALVGIPMISGVLNKYMFYVLLFAVCLGIAFEKNVLYGGAIFLIAGIFGVFTLGISNEIIFPALSGMFGVSNMLISLNSEIKIPEQVKTDVSLGKLSLIKNSILGTVAGGVVGFLPGIGGAQATFLVQQLNPKQGAKEFLVSHAAVNVSNSLIPLFVLYAIGRTRSGIAVALRDVIGRGNLEVIWILLGVALFAGIVAIVLHLKLGVFLAGRLPDLGENGYKKITIAVIVFICAASFMLAGINGLLVLSAGVVIGLLPPYLGVRRAECMGYFALPAIIYYSGI